MTIILSLAPSTNSYLPRHYHFHAPSNHHHHHPPLPLISPFLHAPVVLFPTPRAANLRRSIGLVPACALGAGTGTAAGSLLQDAGATAAVLAGAYSLVFTFDSLTNRDLIQQSLSRKLVHILSGLLFMFSWPIFSNSAAARFFAAVVPLVNLSRLLVHGLSLTTNEGLVKSMTREGKPEELFRGPLYYVVILILCALVFWRNSPTGVISLAMMCSGDGIADIVGRRFGSKKLPHNQHKSWAGSIAMFVFGFLISVGMLRYFTALGYFDLDWETALQRVGLIALVATIVESLPISGFVDDNISVPFATMLTAFLTFGF